MNKNKYIFKGFALIVCMFLSFVMHAEESEKTNYSISGRIGTESFNSAMSDDDNDGVFEYTFKDIKSNVKVSFKISDDTYEYGMSAESSEFKKDIPFAVEKLEKGSDQKVQMLSFNAVVDGEYTVTFDGQNVTLKAIEPEAPTKYLIAGSFMGVENNVSFELVPVEGSDNLFSFTFEENTVGILFFMIDFVITGQDNVYYGAADGLNTPLAGSYSTVSDTDSKKVGSLYFELKEGKKYTITFDSSTNTVGLVVTDATNSPVTITSYYNNSSSDEIIYPEFRLNFTDIATEEYMDNKVTKFEITAWDADLMKRKSVVYSYTAPDTDNAMSFQAVIDELKEKFEYNAETGRYTDKNVFINRGQYIYVDGDYVYRIYLTVLEGTYTRRYTVYSNDFTVNKDGNPLVLSAFYLIQLGDGESNYLTFIDEEHSYPYSVTNSYGQLGQSNQITFSKANFEDGDYIDFGDENLYKFTDKVLVRSNVPFNEDEQWRIDHCELFVQEKDGREIPVINSSQNRNIISDGRFMAIVNLYELLDNSENPKENPDLALTKPLGELTYKLKVWFKDDAAQGSDNNGEGSMLSCYEATVPLTISVPMPRVENNYIELFYGTLNGSNETASFPGNFKYSSEWQKDDESFKEYDLNGARFHNLRKVLVIKSPNVTLNLGKMMQDKATGTFSYSFKYYDDEGKVVLEKPFEINMASDDDKLWTIRSECVLPETLLSLEDGGLYAKEQVACSSSFAKTFPRWTDTDIARIRIEDNPPADTNLKFKVKNWTVVTNQNKELVEQFAIDLFMIGFNDNNIYYVSEDDENASRQLMHNQTTGNANDYFLVEIIDKTGGKEVLAERNNSEENPEKLEMIISATDLARSKAVNIIHNHHKTSVIDEAEYFWNNIEVRVSYLYPFNEGAIRRPNMSAAEVLSRAKVSGRSSNLQGEVVKSQPARITLTKGNDFLLSGINDAEEESLVSIISGKGCIIVSGGEAQIFNISGIKVAEGEGTHQVAPGLYIITTNTHRQKLMVE